MAPDEVALYIHQVIHSYDPFIVMGCVFPASSEWYATRSSLPSAANSWTEVWHGSNKTNRSECCWSINNQQSGVWSLSSVLVDSLLSGKEIMKYYKKYITLFLSWELLLSFIFCYCVVNCFIPLISSILIRAQLFEDRLALNPGLNLTWVSFSYAQKHFLG